MSNSKFNIRHLDITDLQRIERFRRAGYGGSVSDALNSLGICDTVFPDRFKALRQGIRSAEPCRSNYIPWYRE